MAIVFNATFNNISVVSRRSVLLVEETRVPGENHISASDKLYHIVLYIEYTWQCTGFELSTLVVIRTGHIGGCKSNYHTTTTDSLIYHVN
jgi:hypothetical protein